MKRYLENISKYDKVKEYSINEAVDILHGFNKPKFETVVYRGTRTAAGGIANPTTINK